MEKRRRKLTNREWWDAHREQFERTERRYREVMAKLEARIAAERAAEEKATRGEGSA
ncbi:MAG TPA: hypothetical protein VNJ46_06525 [Gaiellaceae bacterium]|nr:hypothetical protein [Gaiellaceae bacterium]